MLALFSPSSIESPITKNAKTASPMYFKTYPPYTDTTKDISWANDLIMVVNLSMGKERDILVEPTKSICKTMRLIFDPAHFSKTLCVFLDEVLKSGFAIKAF